jgi:CheY-like chemotaxis protein
MENARERLLLVEDDLDVSDALRALLQERGYSVQIAANGREALQILQTTPPPRAILLDLMMPWMSGWELLTEMRKIERLSGIPVIVVSALANTVDYLPNGVVGVSKPVDMDQLCRVIESCSSPL